MGVIFISHSSRNNAQAVSVRDWLRMNGWRDTFLDLDPEQGLAPGQRWQEELKKAGERCSAIIVLISPEWVASRWCQVEFLLASQLGKRIFAVIISATDRADLPIELTAHYQIVDISDPPTAHDGLERLRWGLRRAGLDPRDFPWPPPDEPRRSPYRGLRSLEEKDAAVFFGRDAEITRGLDTLRRMRDGAPERLLVILGASGAGKSSFLKAGLLARLRRDEEHFLVLPTVRPARATLTGPEGLLKALGVAAVPAPDALMDRLSELRAPVVGRLERFAEAARETYRAKPPTLVLPIDQGEELFGSDSPESSAVLDLVRGALAIDDNVAVALTIRSDSYANLQAERRLADIPRLPFDLPPLSPGAFKQVIEGPGRLAQPEIVFEPALTDRLVADLDQAGALPLLAFTLERLVTDHGLDGKLGLREYEQELGGLEGAIDEAIEAAFAAAMADPSMPPDRAGLEALARRAFIPWLVKLRDVEDEPRRRVAAMDELPEETRPLVRYFVNQRLLISDARGGEETLEVSHESVLRHWRILSGWIDEERASLLALEAVRGAASEWHRRLTAGRPGSGDEWLVHRGERLFQAEALLHRTDYARLLTEEGRAYLNTCRTREEAERADAEERLRREREQIARQRHLQRRAAIALALVALVTLAFGYFVVMESRAASRATSLVLSDYAQRAIAEGDYERALRLAVLAAREGLLTAADAAAPPTLAAAAGHSSLLLALPGHDGASLWAQSTDGNRWLSWGADGIARVWDATSATEIARQTHERGVVGAAFSADGRRVLSWGNDRTARVWDATSATEIARQVHQDLVYGAVFCADGRRVLSWGRDGTARVWDATSGTEIARQTYEGGELGGVAGAMFSADGRRVLSWGADGTAHVWDAASGAEITPQTNQDPILGAVFAADDRRVLSWGNEIARVRDATSGTEIARQTHQAVHGAVFAADGRRVLSWGWEIARVWDAASGAEIARQVHEKEVLGAVFAADERRVLSWGEGIARVWDATSGAEIARHAHQAVSGAVFAADGRRVLSWGGDRTARVWDAASGIEIARQTHQEEVRGAFFATDARRVLSWDVDGIAHVWDATSRTEIARQTHGRWVAGAVFAADERRVLSWGEGIARVWDAASGTEIARQAHQAVYGAVFAADGRRVLSWGLDRTARVWDAASGTEIARQTHEEGVYGAVFAADGQRVLSWGLDRTARVWDATSGAEIARQRHERWVAGAVFAADGRRVLSWGPNRIARMWDATSGAEIAGQTQIRGAVLAVDGRRVLSLGDGIARVLDATSGTEIARHTHQAVNGAVFAADGRRVLSWGGDRTARVWDAASGAEIARQTHEKQVYGAVFAGDERRVLSWGEGVAYLWDATSGTEIARQTDESEFAGVVFSADGRLAVSWRQDWTARVWDVTSGSEIARQTHEREVAGAVFAADGQRVLSWGADGIARVWEATSGTEMVRQTHEGGVAGAVFAADGRRVLSWGRDGTARVWDVSWSVPRDSNHSLIAEVCERTLRGPEAPLTSSFVNRRGETIAHTSIRRITRFDALAAPLLRDRVGENVCRSSSWFSQATEWLGRFFSRQHE